jgi:hypothetical protein
MAHTSSFPSAPVLRDDPGVVLYVVQGFKQTAEGVTAVEPRSFRSVAEAETLAQVLMQTHSGVLVRSRRFNLDAGYGEPEEVSSYGFIPAWFEAGAKLE